MSRLDIAALSNTAIAAIRRGETDVQVQQRVSDALTFNESVSEEVVVSKSYPRRRDVRARLFALGQALAPHFDEKSDDYACDFLADVRDSMRAGASLEEAVLAAAEELNYMTEAEPPFDSYEEYRDYYDHE